MDRDEAWAWVAEHRRLIRGIVWDHKSNAEADDLMCAAQIGAYEACRGWDGSGTLRGYVGYIVKHRVLDELRLIRRQTGFSRTLGRLWDEKTPLERIDPDTGTWYFPHEPIDDGVEAEVGFTEMVARMSDRERDILSRYYIAGESQAEIGDLHGVSESRIHQIRTAALARLRAELKDEDA